MGGLVRYILAISFVLLLQFSFGVAAALVSGMDRIPDVMMQLFDTQYKDFDWVIIAHLLLALCLYLAPPPPLFSSFLLYLSSSQPFSSQWYPLLNLMQEFLRDFLPQACYIANSTRADRSVILARASSSP